MTDSERIKKVIEWSNLTPNAFSIRIGYKKGQSVYNLIEGKRPITLKIATQISNAFPEISMSWLTTDEGSMLKSNENKIPEARNHTIEEPILNLDMITEIEYLRKQVGELTSTVRDQAGSLRDYAAAEKDNARSRANLTETVITQAHTIANLTKGKSSSKNGMVGA